MIQRIQTVYLFSVFIFAVLFLILPKGNLEIDGMVYQIGSWNIASDDGLNRLNYSNVWGILSMIIPFVIMILTIYTTLIYKQRVLQIKLGKLNMLLHIILVVGTFFYLDALKSEFPGHFSYGIAIVFPLLSMLLILLANRAIRRDEQLVRSADRLR